MSALQMELAEQIQRLFSNFRKTSTSRYTISYLETRRELLEDYWKQFSDEYHREIKDPEISKEEKRKSKEVYFQIEDMYLEFKTIIKERISEQSKDTTPASNKSTLIKLPPINIPTFNGNYRDWLHFKDLFVSLIDENPELSEIQKHHYLRSSLSGEANLLLRHLDVTAHNYKSAWETLTNRYSNQRIVANNILNRLLNQKKLNTECAKGIKELLDTTNECINSLNNLNISTDNWDPIIVHIIVSKLDLDTHKCWEQSLGSSTDLPTFKTLSSYLEGRFRAIEMVQSTNKKDKKEQQSTVHRNIKTFSAETNIKCNYCRGNHYICHCKEFTNLDIEKRREHVKKNGLCFNCLVPGHTTQSCRQESSCKKCQRRHHTFLHGTQIVTKPVNEKPSEESAVSSMKVSIENNQVILATAQLCIRNENGTSFLFRALIDQGSQASFITESAAQILRLTRIRTSANITGIGQHTMTSRFMTQFDIYTFDDKTFVTRVKAHVLTKLSSRLPSKPFEIDTCLKFKNLELADTNLQKPGHIDILLGADVFPYIILEGLIKDGSLIAQNSRLGWLVSGTTTHQMDSHSPITVATGSVEIDQILRKFWEIEEYQTKEKPVTMTDQQCEDHYKLTHTRNEYGRYVVRLPFKQDPKELGNTKPLARNRLLQMEKKFELKPKFQQDYQRFIREYEDLNHMENVENSETAYFLPHHAVVRESSSTTKLRVVFDGSARPATGISLNDALHIGPPLQQDIRELILRWRTHKICLLADIKQMYRQILIAKEDVNYQRILWRNSPNDEITEKRLLTVTYGTSCAPFLAIRTLKQLAYDEKSEFPFVHDIILNDFYMDDLLTGANSEDEAKRIVNEITQVMSRARFEMHKWSSNSTVVLENLADHAKQNKENVTITMDETIKTLGINWNSKLDQFELQLDISAQIKPFTKTTVLSDIARAFDPLGFLSPVIVTAKMFLQKLWISGVSWTDELPLGLKQEWAEFRNQLANMNTIYLDRWLFTDSSSNTQVEVHGFSDASTLAYAAVVYLRVVTGSNIHVSIAIAKSKVAPVKQISLPRLELCGAVLLAKLLKDVAISLKIPKHRVHAWTDSMIVLSWLRKMPNVWKPFVANRTTEILNVTDSDQWHHVPSADNPADLASRGVNPLLISDCDLWWHGPKFLNAKVNISYPSLDVPETELECKVKSKIHVGIICNKDESILYLNRYSKLPKLIRITAYLLRFVKNCKLKLEAKLTNNKPVLLQSYLTVNELREAMLVCVRLSQSLQFAEEIETLRKKGTLPKSTSELKSLAPYIDDNNILRVLGRLHNAAINLNAKSPIILSSNCNFSRLVVEDSHIQSLHGGPQLTLYTVRNKYWIIGAKNLAKKVIRNCLTCFKHSAAPINQLMGQLPACRVNPSKPFLSSGVDYAGPINLKLYPGRCSRTCKAYICLFICTVTKAIHLELVSDLTTSAFLASFRRFTARRGHCSALWSDCATNFVGASRELDRMFKNRNSRVIGEIAELLANDNTSWNFIPPGSPHFGGLWEAGVKSVKNHLKRVIGSHLLTFEEYSTLLTQVEACVNSRPLTPLSDSADDISPLTPGHFLIGQAPITVPEESLLDITLSPLDRWNLVQKMVQTLWLRWSNEYLTNLQNRYKWFREKQNPAIGTVVLIKDERLPPGKWLLGRILDIHPGSDGLTRVVSIKCNNNIFKRPVTKICPLP